MDAASVIRYFLSAGLVFVGVSNVMATDDPPCDSCKVCSPTAANTKSACDTCQSKGDVCCEDKCEECKCTECKTNCTETVKVSLKLHSQEEQDPKTFGSVLSDWLTKGPKLSAQFAIHFDVPKAQEPAITKLVANAPLTVHATETQPSPAERVGLAPQTSSPMKFFQEFSRIQIGDVIWCGHRICSGTKCYDVSDEAVQSSKCDQEASEQMANEEPIIMVPVAPPVPQTYEVALNAFGGEESEAGQMLREAGLSNTRVSVPVATIVELLVAKTELQTRLEMTQQLLDERQVASMHIQDLTIQNARLSAQAAVAETRHQLTDVLVSSLVERAELSARLAAMEKSQGKPAAVAGTTEGASTIQEDLSNIRRQIAILRRSQPVPFATSVVGQPQYIPYRAISVQQPSPYVSTTQIPLPTEPACTCPDCEAATKTADAVEETVDR